MDQAKNGSTKLKCRPDGERAGNIAFCSLLTRVWSFHFSFFHFNNDAFLGF